MRVKRINVFEYFHSILMVILTIQIFEISLIPGNLAKRVYVEYLLQIIDIPVAIVMMPARRVLLFTNTVKHLAEQLPFGFFLFAICCHLSFEKYVVGKI